MFGNDLDHEAFQRVMIEARERHPLRILSYCVMSNHWHFVVWPEEDGQLTAFFRWLTHTHAMRWRVARRSVGNGPLYQGRFKSFPVQDDDHLLTVLRYVERNPLEASLVERAQDWPWASPWARKHGDAELKQILSTWPIERPRNWNARLNTPLSSKELKKIESSLKRGRPFGSDEWIGQQVKELGLEHTVRSEGRPRKVIRTDSGGQDDTKK